MKCVSCSFQEMIMKVIFTVMITTKVVGFKRPLQYWCTKFSLARWLKHSSSCLVIAGHDPLLDITVLMDISRNPGPTNDLFDICSGGQNLVHGGNLHISSSTQTISPSNNGLGARFGIPSLITMRPTVTSGYNRPGFRTLTDVPLVISQCSAFRTNLMKLCNRCLLWGVFSLSGVNLPFLRAVVDNWWF